MKRTDWIFVTLVAVAAVVVFYERASTNVYGAQARQANRRDIPTFEVDPSWPTIPNGWVFGWVSSASVDNQDHVWVLQRPGTLRPEEKPAPRAREIAWRGFILGWVRV